MVASRLAAEAALGAGTGSLAEASGRLAAAAAILALLAWWWLANLDRSLTTSAVPQRAKAGRRRTGLFPWAWAWLPRDRRGAVAAKELRYYGRDPRMRAGSVVWLIGAVALPVAVAVSGGHEHPEIVLASCIFAAWGGLSSVNQFGFEGGAHWLNVVAGTDMRADLVGKNLALAAFTLAVVAAVAVALAAVSGGWLWVPVALAASASILGVAMGVGNVISLRAPQPMPASSTNLFAANTGQGCTSGLLQLLAMTLQGVLLLPVAGGVAFSVAWWRPGLAIAVPLALAWGVLCWRVGLAQAARWAAPRQSEVLAALTPR